MTGFLFAVIHLLSQGRDRRYIIHVPAHVASPAALVVVFHGGSSTPESMEEVGGFDALSDREGFIVAYPAGIERTWNDGRGTTEAAKAGVDDVAFVRQVVRDIEKYHIIDPNRIYASGPSNGGIFSNRLGCEAADLFAAIGPVIGTLASNLASGCHPARPIAVVGIVGVDDPLMPFAGGGEGGPHHLGRGGRVEGVRATQQMWARFDSCTKGPAIDALHKKTNDGTSVTRRTYSGCTAGTEVVWYEIEGGGHRWPPRLATRGEALAEKMFGKSSQNLDAAESLWAFFKAHPAFSAAGK